MRMGQASVPNKAPGSSKRKWFVQGHPGLPHVGSSSWQAPRYLPEDLKADAEGSWQVRLAMQPACSAAQSRQILCCALVNPNMEPERRSLVDYRAL